MKSGRIVNLGLALCVAGVMQVACFAQVNRGLTTPAAQYFANRHTNAAAQGQTINNSRNYVPAPQVAHVPGSKPFQNVQQPRTLSPYLGLDAVPESSTSLPNWHLFVQPQIQQQRSSEAHARELMRVRQQMRVASAAPMSVQNRSGGAPITGSSTQFLNMGTYFPGVR